jgi:hypothetical protein
VFCVVGVAVCAMAQVHACAHKGYERVGVVLTLGATHALGSDGFCVWQLRSNLHVQELGHGMCVYVCVGRCVHALLRV